MRLPDPFTPNLKVDLLPEINQPPHILSPVTQNIPAAFKLEIDKFLETRTPVSLLVELPQKLLLTNPSEVALYGTKYNVPLINALVLYIGIQALKICFYIALTNIIGNCTASIKDSHCT
jgi:CCR4-NOT transcription complex subunit 1